MIENTLLISTAIATILAVLAAWFSFMVSKNSLQFQKTMQKPESYK